MDEVFFGAKPTVDEHYLFDTDDIMFDINNYHISLHFPTAEYFILSELNDEEIYKLSYDGSNENPYRSALSTRSTHYTIIREFYISKKRDNKLKEIGI
jgi:hypothetical protein